MSAIADVVQQGRRTPHAALLPRRTPGLTLAEALAEYPGQRLWAELCDLLPRDMAMRVFMAAEASVRAARS